MLRAKFKGQWVYFAEARWEYRIDPLGLLSEVLKNLGLLQKVCHGQLTSQQRRLILQMYTCKSNTKMYNITTYCLRPTIFLSWRFLNFCYFMLSATNSSLPKIRRQMKELCLSMFKLICIQHFGCFYQACTSFVRKDWISWVLIREILTSWASRWASHGTRATFTAQRYDEDHILFHTNIWYPQTTHTCIQTNTCMHASKSTSAFN